METKTEYQIDLLVIDVKNYLLDAGFTSDLYNIQDFDNERGYIEIFFKASKSIDYIIKDIKKTKWNFILDIKKYKISKENYSAIITNK